MVDAQLTTDATVKLDACVTAYRAALVAESNALEAAQNPGGVNAREITQSIVHDADIRLRKYYLAPQKKRSASIIALQVVSLGCSAAAGVGGNNLKEGWGQALFIVAFILGLTCFAMALIKE